LNYLPYFGISFWISSHTYDNVQSPGTLFRASGAGEPCPAKGDVARRCEPDPRSPGKVEIQLLSRDNLTQQHGFLHGGVVTGIVDYACGYASFSLMAVDAAVLTMEYKVNFFFPAIGERIIAR
jgi:acyl-coenzyme A thioesterase PaaI-like protein